MFVEHCRRLLASLSCFVVWSPRLRAFEPSVSGACGLARCGYSGLFSDLLTDLWRTAAHGARRPSLVGGPSKTSVRTSTSRVGSCPNVPTLGLSRGELSIGCRSVGLPVPGEKFGRAGSSLECASLWVKMMTSLAGSGFTNEAAWRGLEPIRPICAGPRTKAFWTTSEAKQRIDPRSAALVLERDSSTLR